MVARTIQELIDRLDALRTGQQPEKSEDASLEVNELVSSAATFYEKVRYLLDYREEHTIRRSAIERILFRRVLIENRAVDGEDILKELAEGQYVPRESITENAGREVGVIVERFLALYYAAGRPEGAGRRLLSFAATEIERSFASYEYGVDDILIETLYRTVRPHVQVDGVKSGLLDTQLMATCRRSLTGADNEVLAYAMWRMYAPWPNNENIHELAGKLRGILSLIEREVNHPLQWQLSQRIKNEAIYFQIIRELIRKKGASAEWVLTNPKELAAFAKKFLEEQYEHENERLQKSGIRAVVYLFCTKIIAAFIFELPYELFILGRVHYVPLLTNTLFHPALLLVLTRSVGSLDEANTNAIIEGMHKCIAEGKVRAVRIRSQSAILSSIFALVYLMLIVFLFLGIVGILGALQFNIVSVILFLFFLALVSYFAFRIRHNARRWKFAGKDSSLTVIMHVLAFPIVRTGRWLSLTFSSINVFVFFMDFIIETPFKLLLKFSGQFLAYLREKAEDVY